MADLPEYLRADIAAAPPDHTRAVDAQAAR